MAGDAESSPSLGTWRVGGFALLGALALSPWSSPAVALALGMAGALLGVSCFEAQGKIASRWLIQGCVVLLGFRVDLHEVARTAWEDVGLAVGTIAGTLALGGIASRWLRVDRETSLLVSSGTAICGGSAIAAVGTSIGASSASMAVATGAVFVLNAVALYAFPPLGHALGLSPQAFGTWCGVAIHDMSSVNGAAKSYGPEAMDVANIVKLTRVLWIAPIALVAGWWARRGMGVGGAGRSRRVPIPWFIGLFLAASAVRTYIPQSTSLQVPAGQAAGVGFQGALFLIGAGMSVAALKRVGWRALALALMLWVAVAGVSLVVVRWS